MMENAPRGMAAVILRLGYLSVLQGVTIIDIESEKNFVAALEEIQAVAAMFEDSGDNMAFRICQAHQNDI